MPTTASLALRYPASTDRVSDGAVAIQHLADDVDGPLGLLVNPPRCIAYRSAALNLVTGSAIVTLSLDAEEVDTAAMHNPAVNPTRITVPVAGRYTVMGGVAFPGSATGARAVYLLKNGTSINLAIRPGVANNQYEQVVGEILCAAGDYIELGAWQTSGATMALSVGGAGGCYLHVVRRSLA